MPEQSTNGTNGIADGAITADRIAVGHITTADLAPGVSLTADDNPTGAESADASFVPVKDRPLDEQVAYWHNEARKQSKINRERQDYEDVKAKAARLDALEQETQTEHEKAITAARAEAARQARIETLPALISAELRARMVPAEVASAQVELLDLTKFVTDTGELDPSRLDAVARPIVTPTHSPLNDYGRIGGSARGTGDSLSALADKRAAEMTTK